MPYLARSVEALEGHGGPFQKLTELACDLFDVPAAVVSIVMDDETILRASADLCAKRIPRVGSVGGRLVDMGPDGVIVIEDGLTDPRVAGHPLVHGDLGLRFYAGVTIKGPDGKPAGAFGIMDTEPRTGFGEAGVARLRRLAGLAEEIIAGLEQARRGEERLKTLRLVEQMSGVGHWRLDVPTGMVQWSDEVFRIHGVTREDFDPNLAGAVGFYHPDAVATLTGMIENSILTGEGYEAQLKLIRADGCLRHVLTQAGTERDELGKVSALFGVFQDVTEQHELLETARRNESRYRLLAENVDDVITRVRLDGTSKYISPAIKTLLGWTLEEMSGHASEYVHPDDLPAVTAAVLESVATGKSTRLEHRALHRDGSIVWVECTFKAVVSDRGVPEAVIVIRGIDDRKALEAEVIEARDRAEAAAAAKSEFLANMSHELRTPLTSVVGFSTLLQQSEALGATERGYVDRIATASDALLAVINDILDYSKLEAGAIEMEPRPFSPRILAEGAAAIVETQCRLKGLTLDVRIDPDLPDSLTGDEGRLRQVVLNFLSNAAKFTAKGGVTLTMGGAHSTDGALRLRVAVTDTGIGIPAEKLAQVFDRFSQADASTTRVYGGTGLGLAISRRLIGCMGGELGVDSEPGKGSTFWFEVDLAASAGAAVETAAGEASDALTGRILVADDAPANRELVTAILGGLGLTVDAVCDGAEAVQAMQTGAYDLVLMDVHMPVMDGLTATREIRRMQAGAGDRTPILALTANVQSDQVERCREAGMDDHLAKPIQIPALIAALSLWLSPEEPEALAG